MKCFIPVLSNVTRIKHCRGKKKKKQNLALLEEKINAGFSGKHSSYCSDGSQQWNTDKSVSAVQM